MKNHNEKQIWKVLQENPKGIGVTQVSVKSGVSKQTTINILEKLRDFKEINYPPRQSGKKSLITIRHVSKNHVFRKIHRTQKAIEKEFGEHWGQPFFIELSSLYLNDLFACFPDDVDGRGLHFIPLMDMYKLNSKTRKWKRVPESQQPAYIEFKEISKIHVPDLEKLGLEQLVIEDALILWDKPAHDVQKSVKCDWPAGKSHSKKCDHEIHEIISFFYQHAQEKVVELSRKQYPNDYEKRSSIQQDASYKLDKLIRYIIDHGGKIPGANR